MTKPNQSQNIAAGENQPPRRGIGLKQGLKYEKVIKIIMKILIVNSKFSKIFQTNNR